jgi:dihydrofolate reductase
MSGASPITLSLIAAIADNGVIGRQGGLPWRLGSDLKRFRALTMGHPLIMGRRTFDSIPKPLDGRDSIVVTRENRIPERGALYFAPSLGAALALAKERAGQRGVQEMFVIGGAGLFAEALPLAGRIYLTRVHGAPDGDTRWEPDLSYGWVERARTGRPASTRDEFPVTDLIMERVRA